jgi:hypothetical protein
VHVGSTVPDCVHGAKQEEVCCGVQQSGHIGAGYVVELKHSQRSGGLVSGNLYGKNIWSLRRQDLPLLVGSLWEENGAAAGAVPEHPPVGSAVGIAS